VTPQTLEGLAPTGAHRRVALPPGWPLAALFVLYPLWWLLGLSPFVFIGFATVMAWQMWRNRWFQTPPGFWIWGLFLVWVLASAVMLDVPAPDTLTSSGLGRYVAFGMRMANYLAVTVVMLYVINLPSRLVPTKRIIRWISVLFVSAIVGGLIGIVFGPLEITSPMAYILPSSITSNDFVADLLEPSFAQVQSVLGDAQPRPSAPYQYTNAWGNNVSVLLIWFVVGWWVLGGRGRRQVAAAVLALATIPIIYSLNRGMWLGLVIVAVYVALRLASQRKPGLLLSMGVAVMLLPVLTMLPLGQVVADRLDSPHSNDIRASLAEQSIDLAASSPVVGYGSTRDTIGSERSAAIGQTPDCPRCGNRVIGSTGQLWLLLVSQGFVGAFLYVSFFVYSLWRYRSDGTAVGIAGSAAIVLALFFMFFYSALTSPLALYLTSIALLVRNERERASLEAAPQPAVPLALR
jgi:hypothetical protein